jgi:hypothetical protein
MPPKELEKQTRRQRINPRLKAAGWDVAPFDPLKPLNTYDKSAVEEFETRNGPADYALCNDGRALGVVEAKKVTLGPQGVLVQAERYSKGVDCGTPMRSSTRSPRCTSGCLERLRPSCRCGASGRWCQMGQNDIGTMPIWSLLQITQSASRPTTCLAVSV